MMQYEKERMPVGHSIALAKTVLARMTEWDAVSLRAISREAERNIKASVTVYEFSAWQAVLKACRGRMKIFVLK